LEIGKEVCLYGCFESLKGIKEAVSIIIMVSQKSAPVAVAVISYITDDMAQKGLFTIPCLIGQLSQVGKLLEWERMHAGDCCGL
jgi:hypothetical protein